MNAQKNTAQNNTAYDYSAQKWAALKKADAENVTVERFNHWAVGWVDYLVISPDAASLVAMVEKMQADIESYPVLDDDDFSELEQEEAEQIWKNCYSQAERVKYIREFRSQFEFRGLRDAIGCINGDYFAGYASELIN